MCTTHIDPDAKIDRAKDASIARGLDTLPKNVLKTETINAKSHVNTAIIIARKRDMTDVMKGTIIDTMIDTDHTIVITKEEIGNTIPEDAPLPALPHILALTVATETTALNQTADTLNGVTTIQERGQTEGAKMCVEVDVGTVPTLAPVLQGDDSMTE